MLLRRRPTGQAHERTILVVLLLSLGVTAVLAYQAQQAARSHRRSAEAALADYAAFASWELGRKLEEAVSSTLDAAILRARIPVEIALLTSESAAHDAASLDRFRASLWPELEQCGCGDAVHDLFALDLVAGTAHRIESRLPPSFDAWLATVLLTAARVDLQPDPAGMTVNRSAPGTPQIRFRFEAGPDGGPPDPAAAAVRPVPRRPAGGGIGAVSVQPLDGSPDARVVYTLLRDARGRVSGAYGFVLDGPAFAASIARTVIASAAILPPSLTRGRTNDELLALRISTGSGLEIYRSAGAAGGQPPVIDSLNSDVVSLVTEVAVRGDVAGMLLIGGLPRSRLPVLLLLFCMTSGLLVIAAIQLRRQQALARLRSDFVSGVSHELRTPLAQISLFAQLLELGRLRPEQRQRSIRIINEESQRLTYLVDNVLQFSRSGRREQQIAPVPTACAPLIRSIVEGFSPLARARGTAVRVHAEEDLEAEIDANAFRQVLLNLLDNAVKYGPAKQCVVVHAVADGAVARIAVEDEGPGIDPADREHVWRPYHRLERDRDVATGGSGIGLAVVRELVHLHGGTVAIESTTAGGARFVIGLPRSTDRRTETAPRRPRLARLSVGRTPR